MVVFHCISHSSSSALSRDNYYGLAKFANVRRKQSPEVIYTLCSAFHQFPTKNNNNNNNNSNGFRVRFGVRRRHSGKKHDTWQCHPMPSTQSHECSTFGSLYNKITTDSFAREPGDSRFRQTQTSSSPALPAAAARTASTRCWSGSAPTQPPRRPEQTHGRYNS